MRREIVRTEEGKVKILKKARRVGDRRSKEGLRSNAPRSSRPVRETLTSSMGDGGGAFFFHVTNFRDEPFADEERGQSETRTCRQDKRNWQDPV